MIGRKYMDKKELQERLDFRQSALKEARTAYIALLSGQVQSYEIGSRSLTKLDLARLKKEIEALEMEVDELAAKLRGGARRRALGVVPRDW